ncbi:hypothetical protein [Sphaerotilus mobilis]|uniref:Uncharacterized protein n=1 Tax=Sphaerotilus mobilis TaxID=47994 RepID=A0A4Q7LRA1_9BURK|nr:hypothetical protein [Sphaerotilus mobilis]RZS56712.1 hypothetical protein EV685_1266 [Sphaerotilus mobilis]
MKTIDHATRMQELSAVLTLTGRVLPYGLRHDWPDCPFMAMNRSIDARELVPAGGCGENSDDFPGFPGVVLRGVS